VTYRLQTGMSLTFFSVQSTDRCRSKDDLFMINQLSFLSHPLSCLMTDVSLPEPRMRTDYPACRTRGRARCPAQPGPAAPPGHATATRPDLGAGRARPCSGATKPRPRLLMTCGPQPCRGSPGSRSPSFQFCSYQPWTEQKLKKATKGYSNTQFSVLLLPAVDRAIVKNSDRRL